MTCFKPFCGVSQRFPVFSTEIGGLDLLERRFGAKMIVLKVKRCELMSKVSAKNNKVVGCVSEIQCVRSLANRGDKSPVKCFLGCFGLTTGLRVFLVEKGGFLTVQMDVLGAKMVVVQVKRCGLMPKIGAETHNG